MCRRFGCGRGKRGVGKRCSVCVDAGKTLTPPHDSPYPFVFLFLQPQDGRCVWSGRVFGWFMLPRNTKQKSTVFRRPEGRTHTPLSRRGDSLSVWPGGSLSLFCAPAAGHSSITTPPVTALSRSRARGRRGWSPSDLPMTALPVPPAPAPWAGAALLFAEAEREHVSERERGGGKGEARVHPGRIETKRLARPRDARRPPPPPRTPLPRNRCHSHADPLLLPPPPPTSARSTQPPAPPPSSPRV